MASMMIGNSGSHLAEKGAMGYCIPEPLMLHRKHPTSMSANLDSIATTRLLTDIKSLHPHTI